LSDNLNIEAYFNELWSKSEISLKNKSLANINILTSEIMNLQKEYNSKTEEVKTRFETDLRKLEDMTDKCINIV
jgi:hypothetical protein